MRAVACKVEGARSDAPDGLDAVHDFKEGKLVRGLDEGEAAAQAALGANDAGPAKDEDWQNVEMRAALLNEASYVLMDDGRCPDAVWADAATKKLRPASADLLAAAKEKNLENAKKAFGTLTGACKDCHTVHRKTQ